MNKIWLLAVAVVCIGIAACAGRETVKSLTACEVDGDATIEMERVSFKISPFWKSLSPCGAVMMFHDVGLGNWEMIAMGAYLYNDVVATTYSIGMEVNTDMNYLGVRRAMTPEEWHQNALKKVKQEKQDKAIESDFFHNYEKVTRNGMSCWREEEGKWLIPSPGAVQSKRKTLRHLGYTCWPESQRSYPPITITTGHPFRQGKPVYPDIDLEKDILDPVFASLKVKELTEEQYNQRVQKNKEAKRKRCEESYDSYLDRLASKPGIVTDASMNNMLDCGYNGAKQRRCDALAKRSKALKQNYILTHRKLGYNMERLEQTMRVCDYSEEAVADYKQALCANSLKWFSKQLRYKKYRPYTWVTDHLKQCGYENDPVYQEGKKRAIVEGARIIRAD